MLRAYESPAVNGGREKEFTKEMTLRAADEILLRPEGTPSQVRNRIPQRNKKVGLVVNEYGDIRVAGHRGRYSRVETLAIPHRRRRHWRKRSRRKTTVRSLR